ncbi:pyruvate kinase [Persicobacter sp. CCB-QB2]|uniref:pyruvate kinase n=1 Tax=Persicobacter sp. CCB-QB2 TaxID=1561025 RepID=UPI0006A99615|nr:pyruvate kinase [Persicobacter sp. CCB-QB2]
MSISTKRTKIVATVGPSSNTKEMLLQFAVAGVNVMRLNFSHGTHEDHLKVINHIREINKEFNFNISILQDLQGPKIRVGMMKDNGQPIETGQDLIITTEECEGTSEKVSTVYQNFSKDVKVGEKVLMDDGRIQLLVKAIDGKEVLTEVLVGGLLKSRKGINLPDTNISEPALTHKDLIDLEFGLEQNVDIIALSFVRNASDVEFLRTKIQEAGRTCRIISKIERPEALVHIDKIIKSSDAIMVARGDLAIETNAAEVPLVQKSIIKKCHQMARPVVVATQMLESMVKSPIATRAETNDVANAVMDGADGVMLSEESAAGQFPLDAVKTMADICRTVELSAQYEYDRDHEVAKDSPHFMAKEVVHTGTILASSIGAKAIIGNTTSGFTATNISRYRPKAKIFIFTNDKSVSTQLNLIWGVQPFLLPKTFSTLRGLHEHEEKTLLNEGVLEVGDSVVHVSSFPMDGVHRTNMLKCATIEENK